MLARLRSLVDVVFGRDRFEREMRDEVRFHLDARADDLQRAGLSREEAMRRARMEFGGLDSIKDDCRQARGVRWFDEVTRDLRYALRMMARTPGFTVAAVVSLALGIGANTAIFSLMDAVMLRTLPVHDPQELVFLAHGRSVENAGASSNYPLYDRYRNLGDVFDGITAYSGTGFKVATADGLESVTGLWASGNFHGMLGVPMVRGRGFAAEIDRSKGSAPIAVISDAFWARRFSRDPNVLERPLTVDGRAVTIVGVTAPGFTGLIPGLNPDVTLPISVRAIAEPEYLDMHDTWTNLTIVGRLKAGIDGATALAATDVAFQQYMSEPENQWIRKQTANGGFDSAQLVPAARGSAVLRRQYETALSVLMGMVAIVLLIASVNVANLLLARSTARSKEVAIRLCVGGARSRLVRQFLTESLLLAVFGGVLGVIIATWGTSAIMGLLAAVESPTLLDVSPNVRVLAFTTTVTVLTGIAFGLVPAIKSTRVDLTPALKEGPVIQNAGKRWSVSHALVATQVGLSVLVLAVAGLLVRSLVNLKSLDAGFTGGNLLLFSLDTYGSPIKPDERAQVYRDVMDRVRTLPGVLAVAASRSTPVHTSGNARALVMPDDVPDTVEARGAFANQISPEYFDTMGIRLLAGRAFTAQDSAGSPLVAVVNESMAKFWARGRDPLGQTLAFRGDPKAIITIVGVVEDTHQMNLREPPPRTVYTPLAHEEPAPQFVQFEVRTAQEPAAMANTVRAAIREVSKDVVVWYVRTIDQQIDASLVRERLLATLSGGFALLALILSAVGLYGVMSYNVTRRSREIGIRMALGAARARLLGQVLGQTFAVSAAGIVVGVAAALLTTRALSTFLFGLSERDPVTLASVCVLLLLTSLVAGFIPARRAATLDPVQAIKSE